jgi:hypothetical protein
LINNQTEAGGDAGLFICETLFRILVRFEFRALSLQFSGLKAARAIVTVCRSVIVRSRSRQLPPNSRDALVRRSTLRVCLVKTAISKGCERLLRIPLRRCAHLR